MLHPAIKRMFWVKKHPLIFGMIHVPALPGTPKSSLQMGKIAEKVIEETEIYAKCQIDGIILENMHDLPYQLHTNHGPEICASMTRLCLECSNALGRERREFLLGVQILAAANKEALSVAMAADFDFIRAEAYVFSHVADEGWMDGCAGNLLRYRRSIGAEGVAVVADVKKKHSAHAITADISVAETAKASEFFLADGIVLTGNATGHEACPTELKEARSSCSLPIFMGSGITTENVHKFSNADAFIVGSYFKKDGKWNNEIDEGRVKKLVEEVSKMRRSHIIPGDS